MRLVGEQPASAAVQGLGRFDESGRLVLQEETKMITRLIIVQVPEGKMAAAERTWKEVCGAKMIALKGCLSEQLLRCNEVRGEYISMATWDSMASIQAYR